VLLLPAGNPSEWTGPTGNNTWLLAGPPSVLVDAGVGREEHLDAIARSLSGAPLDLVLLTHGHVDHVAGVPMLRARWPGVDVRGSGERPLVDGEVVRAGRTVLEALHTPGHAPDHFCFLDRDTRDVYCGDLARLGGTIVIPAGRGGDLRAYLESLRRIRALEPRRLLPAHGPVVDEPRKLLDAYIVHRGIRTEQIRLALADGQTTVDGIVARLYPGLSERLLEAARDTVRAHLEFICPERNRGEESGPSQ
jgi:glyoxylase-like metal-dependent hydrolase (beta-lactamase superfamily II)